MKKMFIMYTEIEIIQKLWPILVTILQISYISLYAYVTFKAGLSRDTQTERIQTS